MTDLEKTLTGVDTQKAISILKEKTINLISWEELQKEYDPMQHSVMREDGGYTDLLYPDGSKETVSRITYDLQRLAVKRMTELCFGIPVKRIYSYETDEQQQIADVLESILLRNRINSVNIERSNMLFAACETMTLWYAVEEDTEIYGVPSKFKLRCRNFSPMNGDELYPLFDQNGDLIALSVAYLVKVGDKQVSYFDAYTSTRHMRWENQKDKIIDEEIVLGKIPAIYMFRPTPIWENTSSIVNEMEWTMSRNGNYLRKNSKPTWVVCADEEIGYGKEKNENTEFRTIVQYPAGTTKAGYETWQQAIDNLKFYMSELKQQFFTTLQLPDMSMESMKATPMSGEARKMMFIDAQLKVTDESGRLLEFLDREVNVVKSFMKIMMPGKEKLINTLKVENVITPYQIHDDSETISNLMAATGGKAIMSQLEAIRSLGWSDDAEQTLKQIQEESKSSVFDYAE